MGLAVERLPLTLHWKKLYISGRSNDNETSWELIMAAHTSWHSSEAASGEKQSKEKNGTSRFLSLP